MQKKNVYCFHSYATIQALLPRSSDSYDDKKNLNLK